MNQCSTLYLLSYLNNFYLSFLSILICNPCSAMCSFIFLYYIRKVYLTSIYYYLIPFNITRTSDRIHSVGFFMSSNARMYTSIFVKSLIFCVKLVPAPTKRCRIVTLQEKCCKQFQSSTIKKISYGIQRIKLIPSF
jgi:hypothetical protein